MAGSDPDRLAEYPDTGRGLGTDPYGRAIRDYHHGEETDPLYDVDGERRRDHPMTSSAPFTERDSVPQAVGRRPTTARFPRLGSGKPTPTVARFPAGCGYSGLRSVREPS